MQRGRPSWKGRGAFWDKLRIWWSFWVLGRWSGSGWQVSGHPRRIDCCLAGRKEAEASGEKQGGPQPLAPTPGLPLVHASAPRSCYRRRAGSSWSSTGRSTVPRRCSPCTAASAPASPASASASCHGCRPVCGGSRPGLQGGGRAGTGRHKSQDRFACSPREHLCPYPCSLLEYPQSREAHYWSRPHKPAVLIP